MTPSIITQIILRMFALGWLFQSIIQLVTAILLFRSPGFSPAFVVTGIVLLVSAGVVWVKAPFLSQLIAGTNTARTPVRTLDAFDLMTGVIVGVGLYFALSSFASLLNSIHYFILTSHAPTVTPDKMKVPFYDLTRSGVTFCAGIFLIVTSSQWAKKIVKQMERTRRSTERSTARLFQGESELD